MEFGSHTPISMDSSLSQTPRHPACAHHELRLPAAHHDNNPTSTPMSNPLQRAQWLRAAILGANDGLLSTTSLMLGVGAAKEDRRSVILSGIAGAVAGACSMAVGEFVSVSTQRDIHRATAVGSSHSSSEPTKPCPATAVLIDANPAGAGRPMSPAMTGDQKSPPSAATPERKSPLILPLARSPAMKVIAEDEAKMAGNQDDGDGGLPNPYKAAAASALAFLAGSIVPFPPAMLIAHNESRMVAIVAVTTVALAVFGGVGAYAGGSPVRVSAVRVLLGGWASMAIAYGLLKPLDKDTAKDHEA